MAGTAPPAPGPIRVKPAPRRALARQAVQRRPWLVNLLTVAGLVVLMLAVSGSAPRWSRFLRQSGPVVEDETDTLVVEPTPSDPHAGQAQRTISVKLFFERADNAGLVIEERTLSYAPDLARQVEIVVRELLAGSKAGHLTPLPAETQVLNAFVTGRGVAYVNLSKPAFSALDGGTRSELLSVYALVDTLAANFPAISRVQVLVEDHPAESLNGHIDLARALPPDMTLLADLPTAVSPAPESLPATATPPVASPPAPLPTERAQ